VTGLLGPQETVERALAAGAHLTGCVAIVSETSEAVLRWANSTMTTNGHTTSSRVTVIAFVDVPGGTAAGTVSSGERITDPERLADLVAAAERSARTPGPRATPHRCPSRSATRTRAGPSRPRRPRSRSTPIWPRAWPRSWPGRCASSASPTTP
jgi:hypothetical protein